MNIVYLCLLGIAFIAIQCMAGGTRLVFSLPCYIVIALAAILTALSARRAKAIPNLSCLTTTTLMGGYVVWRTLNSPWEYLARADFFMMLACLAVYLLTAFYLPRTRDRKLYVILLLALVVPEVIYGTIQFTQSNGYMPFGFLRGDDTQRASGMFVSPNHFAGYLETVAIIALSMAVWSRWPVWGKILSGYIAATCWFGIAISGSRGGYFSTMFSLVAFACATIYAIKILDPQKLVRAWLFLTVGIGLTIGVAAFLMLDSDFLTKRIHLMTAKDIRIYNWMAALDQFHLNRVFGTGAGTHLIYGRLFRQPQIQSDPIHAHCDYLELLAEYGVVGAVVTAAFLFTHVRNGLRSYSFLLRKRMLVSYEARSDSFALTVGVLCSLVALGVHSMVDFNMHAPGDALLYAFLFGTLASPGLENEGGVSLKIAQWFRFALPPLGVWLMLTAVPKLPSEYCSEVSRVALRNGELHRSIEYAEKALGRVASEPTLSDRMIASFGADPQNFYLHFYIGEATRLRALGVPGKMLKASYFRAAAESYRNGLAILPQNEALLVRLGQALDGAGLYDEAEQAYQKAIELDPNLGAIYGYYGSHLEAVGKKAEAAEAYQKGRHLGAEAVEQLGRKELGL